ncbi:serine/threonine protein kinase [Fictibacillus phosphorivorans]|uniref:serine/threonine protein kinase n=1 Tax=Fictibacillus phosphorivorans TaxID=1221500 RepID=UPI002040A1C8|nr:serine/threonine protein kinase [Fictibacillus phosphorivorans]MCM3718659.1 serine/threonine protein kinase [Fictibacillus phosphorivorans]MCM3776282.1 serine/threonine protein kinase [Fictibacillus phosphorivorans]
MERFIRLAQQLNKEIMIESRNPLDPVCPVNIPYPWKLLGCGNYAAVFGHPDYPSYVVKIYGRDEHGLLEEKKVYERLGEHPGYSVCYYTEKRFLILKRIQGITLYDCVHKGIRIPESVIRDVDDALDYAKKRGLFPNDVHGKNVMISKGKGIIVDVSDFYKKIPCRKWKDLRKAYFKIYKPIFYRFPIPVPHFVLNAIRIGYRYYSKAKISKNKGNK